MDRGLLEHSTNPYHSCAYKTTCSDTVRYLYLLVADVAVSYSKKVLIGGNNVLRNSEVR